MSPLGNVTTVQSPFSVQAEVKQSATSTRSSQSNHQHNAPRRVNKNWIFVEFPQASKSTRVGGPHSRRPKMDERARENIVNQIRKKNGIALPDQVNSQAKQIALVEALDRAYSYESLAETAKDMWTWMATATRSLSSYMPEIQIGPPAVEAGLLSNVIEVTKPSTISEFLKSYQNDFDIQISRSLKLDDSVKGVTIIVGTKEKDQGIEEKIARVLAGMKSDDGDLLFIPGFTPGCKSAMEMYKLRYANCKELNGDHKVKSNVPLDIQKLVLFQLMLSEHTKATIQISNLLKKTTDSFKKIKSKIENAEGLEPAELVDAIKKEEFQDFVIEKKIDPSSVYVGNSNYMDMEEIYSKFKAAIDDGKRLKIAIDGSITITPYKSLGEDLVNQINIYRTDSSTNYAAIDIDELLTVADDLCDGVAGNAIVMIPHNLCVNSQYQSQSLQQNSKSIDL